MSKLNQPKSITEDIQKAYEDLDYKYWDLYNDLGNGYSSVDRQLEDMVELGNIANAMNALRESLKHLN